MDWREHITFDPSVCHGQACNRRHSGHGHRRPQQPRRRADAREIAESYPSVSADAIAAALQYAAELARERVLPLGA